MQETLIIGIGAILILGILAQWAAWLFRLPSILLLLAVGFIVGPVFGIINPDAMFGDLLFPVVSLAVGLILFEGGLSLRVQDFKEVRRTVKRLVSVGPVITVLVGTFGAHYLLGLDYSLSLLLASILTVSGPTVVTPLLEFVQPTDKVRKALHWEGILIDPIGAAMAVIIFTALESSASLHLAPLYMVLGVFMALIVGSLLGVLGAFMIVFLFKRDLVPENLQPAVAMVMALAMFLLSNALIAESGLMAAIVMGVILANQKAVNVQRIIEFEENITVLLLSGLFIVLAARVELAALSEVLVGGLALVGLLVFVARPVTVWLSTRGTDFSFGEKAFLAWMAPRGIVAVSVASLFSLELAEMGYPGAEQLMAITFVVVAGTVALYSLTARPVARMLGVAEAEIEESVVDTREQDIPAVAGQGVPVFGD